MASEEELKTMIKCFRVVDLQVLLSFAGRSKAGKKRELQERALELLQLKSQPLVLKIRHLYDSMQKGYVKNGTAAESWEVDNSPPSTTERDDGGGPPERDEISVVDISDSQAKDFLTTKEPNNSADSKEFQNPPVQPHSSVQLAHNSLYLPIPIHPDVKFKKLPFYEILFELLRPCSLVPHNYNFQQKNSFMFYITPQQAAAIAHSRDQRSGFHNEFKVQGQLRFCLLETTSPQNDSYPSSLILRVNNKFCYVQESPMKKKKDVYVKEPSPPINITPLMKLNASEGNKIDVQWSSEYGAAYVIAVYLVQRKTSEDLLNHLKANRVRCPDYTRGMIKDKLNEEADSEIITMSVRVSLMCPLGKMRLKTACRASTCQHLQCFDASLYIQMNERKATWTCPVCDNPAEYDQLVIDEYFQEILSSDSLPPEVNEVELHGDGTWSYNAMKAEEASRGSLLRKVETEETLDVIIEEPKGGRCEGGGAEGGSGGHGRSGSESEKRRVDEIDLTMSDSDDEPLSYYKRKELTRSKRNCMLQSNGSSNHSNSNSNRSSPSVINVDSDSSDSLPLMISAQFPVLHSLL